MQGIRLSPTTLVRDSGHARLLSDCCGIFLKALRSSRALPATSITRTGTVTFRHRNHDRQSPLVVPCCSQNSTNKSRDTQVWILQISKVFILRIPSNTSVWPSALWKYVYLPYTGGFIYLISSLRSHWPFFLLIPTSPSGFKFHIASSKKPFLASRY